MTQNEKTKGFGIKCEKYCFVKMRIKNRSQALFEAKLFRMSKKIFKFGTKMTQKYATNKEIAIK